MLGVAMYNTIDTLWKRGFNKSEISRQTGHDWKTVDKVIRCLEKGQHYPCKQAHPSQLDHYKAQIIEWLEHDLSGVRIHEKLQDFGLKLSYSAVKVYIKKLRGKRELCIRFHTLPGEEAQVDFGYVGRLPDKTGRCRKAWVFNMRLCYSRLDYYEVVFDQRVETFIQCHQNAFEYFGGVPACVKIDNLKAAVLQAHFYEPVFQALYKQFAHYYQFSIIPCRVRQPQEKGKVEAGIKYIKNNFFKGRHFYTHQDLKTQLRTWLEDYCNPRIHGTTRQKPRVLFDDYEKNHLRALPNTAYRLPQVGTRTVQKDGHIYIDYNYYSVPYQYVGQSVDIEVDEKIIRITQRGEQLAIHAKAKARGQFVTQKSHCPPHKQWGGTEHQKNYQTKMTQLGHAAEQLFLKLLQTQPHHWHQSVRGILSLQQDFSPEIINLACQRALNYGALGYRQIKSIGQKGCYVLPIDPQQGVYHS